MYLNNFPVAFVSGPSVSFTTVQTLPSKPFASPPSHSPHAVIPHQALFPIFASALFAFHSDFHTHAHPLSTPFHSLSHAFRCAVFALILSSRALLLGFCLSHAPLNTFSLLLYLFLLYFLCLALSRCHMNYFPILSCVLSSSSIISILYLVFYLIFISIIRSITFLFSICCLSCILFPVLFYSLSLHLLRGNSKHLNPSIPLTSTYSPFLSLHQFLIHPFLQPPSSRGSKVMGDLKLPKNLLEGLLSLVCFMNC